MRLRTASALILTTAAAGTFAAGGCTATVVETAAQCHSEDDCRSRGPEFAETTCSVDRVCVPLVPEKEQCSSNQECTERNSGVPHRCLPQTKECVPITSTECPRIFGEQKEWANDNAIFIGMTYPNDPTAFLMETATDLARTEIMTATAGGLPSATPGGPKRPLVFIGCPSDPLPGFSTVENSIAAAKHLARLRVPAVLGPTTPPAQANTARSVFIPNKVSIFSILLGNRVTLPPDPLITFMGPPTDVLGPATMVPPVKDWLEARAIAAGATPGQVKIHVLGSSTPADTAASNEVIRNLRWNDGKTATDPANAQYFKYNPLGNQADSLEAPRAAALLTEAINSAVAFRAHIILMFVNPRLQTVFRSIDSVWPAGVQKPIFVINGQPFAPIQQYVDTRPIADRDGVRRRIFTVTSLPRTPDATRITNFDIALKLRFPQYAAMQPQSGGGVAPTTYNTVYAIAHAIMAAGATQLDGDVLARSLPKLTNGQPIKSGDVDFTAGADILQRGGSITLDFMTGTFALDQERVFQWADGGIICIGGSGGGATSTIRSNYRVDPRTGVSTGAASLNCP